MARTCPAARGVSIADHLRAWDLDVKVVGVPARPGAWGLPRAIFVHHTGDTCDADRVDDVLRVVRDGRGGANPVPGPLAQLMLGQDGRVYIVARARPGQVQPGRANHAGAGSYSRLRLPLDAGNAYAAGIEVQCSGRHPLSRHPRLYRVLVRLLAAWCDYYGLPAAAVIGHREYAPDRKIDPVDDMDDVRRDVAAALAAGPGGPTANPPEDDMPTPRELLAAPLTRLGPGGQRVWDRVVGRKGATPTAEQAIATAAIQAAEASRLSAATLQKVGEVHGLVAAVLQRMAGTPVDLAAISEAARTGASSGVADALDGVAATVMLDTDGQR